MRGHLHASRARWSFEYVLPRRPEEPTALLGTVVTQWYPTNERKWIRRPPLSHHGSLTELAEDLG
jgi:hypothetical protein